MSTFNIDLNEEYKIKIEKGNEFHRSIFKDVYINAAKNVVEIIKQSERESIYDDYNNIIAFTGERGKGKSSSMISFRDALIKKGEEVHKDFFNGLNLNDNLLNSLFEKIRYNKFATIDVIDPSLFRENESLFEIILAKMFSKFQQEIIDPNSNVSDEVRRTLIKHFQKVFENLQIINSNREDLYKQETIEALSKLATSSNLRDCFKELVIYYLDNFENKNYLLIAIDDFDLNISGAYEMLEDIRQFFIQNKIVLLVACKIEQLKEAIAINYKNLKIKNEISDKSKRYIDKLIPFNRRLILPDVQKLDGIEFSILNDGKVLFDSSNNTFNESIINLLFNKNQILQTYNILNKNFVLPETIRETQNFVNTLLSHDKNSKLKDFILDEVLKKNKYNFVFSDLENTSDDLFLLMCIRKICYLYFDKVGKGLLDRLNTSEKSKQFKKLYEAIIPRTISLGDIYFLLREYENILTIDDFNEIEFLDYFKIYFSLRVKLLNSNLTENNFTTFGFVNYYLDILSKENNKKSRDFVNFNDSLDKYFRRLDSDEEKYFLSLFTMYLGHGYQDYRKDLDKDIFVEGYSQGVLSPFAIFHNNHNVYELSIILKFEVNNDYVIDNIRWYEESIFIKQLYNPSFVLNLIADIKEFRLKQVKESLPNNYFDNVCLLFVYGTLYSLAKMESLYKINDLVRDFISYPIINNIIKYFNEEDYNYSGVNELNEKYNILNYTYNNNFISNNIKEIINEIYELSRETSNSLVNTNLKELTPQTKTTLIELLRIINGKRPFTSRVITNRINDLQNEKNTEDIVSKLESIKYDLNSKDNSKVSKTKDSINEYLNELLNGQSS